MSNCVFGFDRQVLLELEIYVGVQAYKCPNVHLASVLLGASFWGCKMCLEVQVHKCLMGSSLLSVFLGRSCCSLLQIGNLCI